MSSIMKKIIAWIIRHTLKPALSPKVSLKWQRRASDLASNILIGPSGYTTQKLYVDQIPVLHIQPKVVKKGLAVLYLHGGGYVVGSAKSHCKLAAHLGDALNAEVWLPEYRLAPEHPCPAAIQDATHIYQWLLTNGHHPDQLIIIGDSAGGGLTLSTAITLREAGLPLPAALVLLSPWVNLTLSASSITSHASRDAMLSQEWLSWCAAQYSQGMAPHVADCSPVYAKLEGLPPTLIHVGTEELLLDDAKHITQKLKNANVYCELHIYDQVGHVFQFHAGILKESNQSIREIAEFAKQYLNKNQEKHIQ